MTAAQIPPPAACCQCGDPAASRLAKCPRCAGFDLTLQVARFMIAQEEARQDRIAGRWAA